MFLYLEDIVPNALIEVMESNITRSLPFSTIMNYGHQVVLELKKRHIDATLVIYRDQTIAFENNYSNVFDFYEHENMTWIKCKPGINSNFLREHFRSFQNVDNLIAMTSYESKKVLGISKTLNRD